MFNKVLIVLGLAGINGWLYRRGGTNKGTLWRDIGCSLVTLATCLYLGLIAGFWATIGAYLLVFGLSWGALASYWGLDEQKFGFWAHGLGLSLAILPIAWITGQWLGFGIRCVVLTGFMIIWSEYTHWDWLEEFGRGFLVIATLPLLLI